ncbi:hypothetical protein CK203_111753 [Vitis vinifera]|uniref:Reverse transcriptase domain-containing protein n=1 Tax=Vitis vinifera TaxID=29760 RepID=A0A438DP03_VITVI|nr:hypothetical protein CK203_111753 [Vitis vinifera]
MWFEACSGLKVNLEKSELIPTGRVERVEELVSKLGCKEGKLPSTYLGLPLDAPFRSVAVWDRVKERTIKLRLEKIQRELLCGGGRLEKKFHPVKWATMCLGKSTPRKEQNTFLCSLSFVMGNGRVKFWMDKWYRDEPWCVSFPSLYAIAISKEEWVEDL